MFARRQIKVTLIDAETGEPMGETSSAPSDLPETFDGYTTVKVGTDTWEVLEAEPADRREYLKTGTLRLQIRKVEITTIKVDELIYNLPTISGSVPDIDEGTSKLGKQILEILEDDWRQIELVSSTQMTNIDACLRSIDGIVTASSTASGFFRHLHVRKEVPRPLSAGELSLSDLLSQLEDSVSFDGLGFRNVTGLLCGAFALRTREGLYIYGIHSDDDVLALGLLRGRTATIPLDDADALVELMEKNKLVLVDWCAGLMLPAEKAGSYIASQIAFQVA